MTIEELDTIVNTLEGYYPGKFSEFTTAEMDHWQQEIGDTPRETVLASVRKWYNQHQRHYAPSLISLLTLVDEIAQEDRRELARTRTANAAWQKGMPGVLAGAADAYVANARDSNTALYGKLMGQLAQRSLADKMSKEALAAQCRQWAMEYPQIADHMGRAAGQFSFVDVPAHV